MQQTINLGRPLEVCGNSQPQNLDSTRTVVAGQLNVATRAEGLGVARAGRQIRHAGVPQLQQTRRRYQSLKATNAALLSADRRCSVDNWCLEFLS